MKTKVTWRTAGANGKTLKLDDTKYDHFPEVGEIREIGDHVYRVEAIESAVVVLEAVPQPEPMRETATLQKRNERVAARIADEKVVVKQVPRSQTFSPVRSTAPVHHKAPTHVVSHKKK